MKRSILAVLWVSLSMCTVGPQYTPPSFPVPAAFRDAAPEQRTASPESLDEWWTVFRDPLLESLTRRAIEGNLDLAIADARVREARAARGIAASAALPQVSGGGRFGRAQRSDAIAPLIGPRTQNLFEIGWDASWELDLFGGVRRDKEAALAQAQAVEEARRDVLVTLLADVARSYIELRAAQSELRIVDETLRSRQETLELVRARARAGLEGDLGVARAEEAFAAAAAQRPLLVRRAGEAIHSLGVLLGEDPDALFDELSATAPFPAAPEAVPPPIPSELLSRRPDLRRAERELAAATARVGVAHADLFPRFVILGDFGRRSDDLADLGSGRAQFGGLLAGARWPVLSGGRIRANIRIHDARQEQSARLYEKAILTALQEVADSLLRHARERERQQSLRDSAEASRRVLEMAVARYKAGLENYLSVLDAQRALHTAEQLLIQSERDLSLSLIALYKSLGGGWSA